MLRAIIIIFTTISVVFCREPLFENKFLFDNEGWQITGNQKIEPAAHQSYNLNNEISHYIMFKDKLINTDYKNLNDKSLWYFESPEITINLVPKMGSTSSINFKPKYPSLLTFTMTSFVGDFNNLNENTNLVKLKNKDRCLTFEAPEYYGKTHTFNVYFISELWKHYNTFDPVTDEEMNEMFIGPFTIEILGDWTRDVEVIGIDNVKII